MAVAVAAVADTAAAGSMAAEDSPSRIACRHEDRTEVAEAPVAEARLAHHRILRSGQADARCSLVADRTDLSVELHRSLRKQPPLQSHVRSFSRDALGGLVADYSLSLPRWLRRWNRTDWALAAGEAHCTEARHRRRLGSAPMVFDLGRKDNRKVTERDQVSEQPCRLALCPPSTGEAWDQAEEAFLVCPLSAEGSHSP